MGASSGRACSPGWRAAARSSLNRDEGFTKLLFDPDTHRVVGGGIVGTQCRRSDLGSRARDRDGRRRRRHRAHDPSAPDAVGNRGLRGGSLRRHADRPLHAEEKVATRRRTRREKDGGGRSQAFLRVQAEVRDRAHRTQRARLADVTPVQDEPVMRIARNSSGTTSRRSSTARTVPPGARPVRFETRKICVSTAIVGSPKAVFRTTFAVLRPTPGRDSSSARSRGTSPP